MNSYKSALTKLKKNKLLIKNEKIILKHALNRISAKDVFSPVNYPASNNTAFDGFAVNSKETKLLSDKKSKKFKIIKILAAGDNPNIKKKIPKFSAVEVMTGAIIKKPFDTIIPIEKIKFFPSKLKPKYIILQKKLKKNQFIRPAGSDFKKRSIVINKGEFINPSHILAFKTLGIDNILVKKKPNIVFYPTGNELSNLKKIPSWKIRNSNSIYLDSFIKNLPINFKEKKILRDGDLSFFKKEIKKNIKLNSDIVITSGAVSAGKFDFIPSIVNQFKLKSFFKGVSIRPGKPLMFAKFLNNKCFFGLPGNPLSTVACFRFFVLPFLFKSLELVPEKPIVAKIKKNFSKKKNFTRFIKGKLTFTKKGFVEFEIFKGQESYKINPFVKSNAWGVFEEGISNFKKGSYIECYSIHPLMGF
ncbi:molybdopterin molybdotransferase MoeA [bacterium]|nr:molybdopterin molybdotransferase MoeA [bacterium]